MYETLPGWSGDVSGCRSFADLPENCRKYVERIEEILGVPVSLVSVGPDRRQTIER